jgi:monovalent cation:proton antiporter-2 (CPA2) family protein
VHGQDLFLQAFIYLAAAVIAVPLAQRLGLGSVLGYLIAGMVIGPFGVGFIGESGDVMHVAEFGVVLMLFVIGLELQPSRLWTLRRPILGLGGLQVVITTLAVAAVALALGLPGRSALAVGMILALSSTAIVMQTLAEKGLMNTDGGQSAFSTLLFQDIAVIPILAILPLLALDPSARAAADGAHTAIPETWTSGLPGWGQALVVLGAVGVVIGAGRFLVRPAFRLVARTRLRETFTAAALVLVIGIALLMTQVGLSPALGTFLAGVVLATSEYRHALEADIDPFKGLLLGVFFISVGASVDFAMIASRPAEIAALVAALMGVKLAVLLLLGRIFRMHLDQNILYAVALAQGGEFAFLLFAFATGNQVLDPEVTGPLVAVVAISMALTPLAMLLNDRVIRPRVGTRERESVRPPDVVEGKSPVLIAGFGRFGNVVGRLLWANGAKVTVLDFDSDRVDVLRKLGLEVHYGDASRMDLLAAAGAAQARLLVVAIDDAELTMRTVLTARQHFPHLVILARASGREEAHQLLEAGVEHVYRETLDTSLRMGSDVLRMLGHRGYRVHRAARTFRDHDEDSVRALHDMRHDSTAYLTEARRRIHTLEEILRAEVESSTEWRDEGWDTTSLREEASTQSERPGASGG